MRSVAREKVGVGERGQRRLLDGERRSRPGDGQRLLERSDRGPGIPRRERGETARPYCHAELADSADVTRDRDGLVRDASRFDRVTTGDQRDHQTDAARRSASRYRIPSTRLSSLYRLVACSSHSIAASMRPVLTIRLPRQKSTRLRSWLSGVSSPAATRILSTSSHSARPRAMDPAAL